MPPGAGRSNDSGQWITVRASATGSKPPRARDFILFRYAPETGEIEIKRGGVVYTVSLRDFECGNSSLT
jgi:hypothetical protein